MDKIAELLKLLSIEISTYSKVLKNNAKDALDENRFSDLTAISSKSKRIVDFNKKLDALSKEWENNFSIEKKVPTYRSITSSPKSSRTKLRVTFRDNSIVLENSAANTFVKSLYKIGFQNIKNLNLKVRGLDLISDHKDRDSIYQQHEYRGSWIVTHSSTLEKKDTLDSISQNLGLGLRVEIV